MPWHAVAHHFPDVGNKVVGAWDIVNAPTIVIEVIINNLRMRLEVLCNMREQP